ncbi:MAG: DUF1801 domain-containing protein [Pseudomonadota bacterium]
MAADPISAYAKSLTPKQAAICANLRKALDAGLPTATSKVWHAIPVWFIGDNPVVGYTQKPKGVALMFWNGQSFEEPSLEAVGSFKAAHIIYTDASQISSKDMSRWLKKAATDIWDLAGLRKKAVAKKKKAA